MEWLVVGALAGGFVIGWFTRQFTVKAERDNSKSRRDLEKAQVELEQYKQQVNDHFSHTAQLLEEATESYCKMYRQIAAGADALLEQSPVTLPKFIEHVGQEEQAAEIEALPPRDYASTSHGLIRDKEKQSG